MTLRADTGPTITRAGRRGRSRMVVTKLVYGSSGSLADILVTYHTTNRLNKSMASLMRQYPRAAWWGIHLAESF